VLWSNQGFGQPALAAFRRGGSPVEAVIVSGGKQYRVREGDIVRLERLPSEQGGTVEFREVAYLRGEGDPVVDPARLDAARVLGQVVRQGRDRKLIVVKFKRRKNYRRRQGHRQAYTAVRITRIDAGA
jgi:large subunit ribosomal protein L21